MDPESHGDLDETMADIARQAGGSLHAYPRPGQAVRSIVLRDIHDDRGTQFEVAQIENDGTLRVMGHDTGPRVTEFFGDAITNYEWVYVIAPERIDALLRMLGADHSDDALAALAAYHQLNGGQISELLRGPEVAARFDNWPS